MGRSPHIRRRMTASAAVAAGALLLLALPSWPVGPEETGGDGEEIRPASQVVDLRRDVRSILDGAAYPGTRWSAIAVSLDRGDTLFSVDPDAPVAPASNAKLFTTAAALHYLGADFRYTTYLVSDAPVEGGVLRGDLILYGTGDPTISDRFHPQRTSVFEELASDLRAVGIQRIEGDVVGDDSYFVGPAAAPGWPRDAIAGRSAADWFAAPATALAFNENVVTLHVTPGRRDGDPPRVEAIPPGGDFDLVNDGRTAGRGTRARIAIRRTDVDAPIRISGTIPRANRGVWRRVSVPDPPRFAASVFRRVLEEEGIEVAGSARSTRSDAASPVTGRTVVAPACRRESRVLAHHRSPPLKEILAVINRESHNHFAETILRTLGRTVVGEGSHRGGSSAVHRFLVNEVGVPPTAVRPVDGSGLSPENRATTRSLVALLVHMDGSPHGETFRASLPEAGSRRGLRRMYRTRAAGNLRAKTGTLDGVSALSGYVRTAEGERIAFSLVANEMPSTWRAKRAEDRVGARLAGFSRGAGGTVTASSATRRSRETVHRVRRGENLTSIARRYGVSLRALREANPGLDPDRIRPGQELTLP